MLRSLGSAILTSAVAVVPLWLGCDSAWTPFLEHRPNCQTDPAACELQDGGAADGLPSDGGTEQQLVCSKDRWCLENPTTPTSPKQDLWQVWGSDTSNVWAVGGTAAPSNGRLLGATPFQQEVFAGSRAIEVRKDRYLPHQSSTQVEPGQTATIEMLLKRDPSTQFSRPLWRVVTDAILLGGGVLVAGIGTWALQTNGKCQDGSMNFDTCSPYYNTTTVGAGLLGGGVALVLTGSILLIVPSR